MRGLPVRTSIIETNWAPDAGKSNAPARSPLGKMLGQAKDDCSEVMRILEHARSLHPVAGAKAYLLKCAQQRGPGGRAERAQERPGGVAWMADLPGFGPSADALGEPLIDLKCDSALYQTSSPDERAAPDFST